MRTYSNKFFICFLILAIAVFGLSVRITYAKGAVDAVVAVVTAVVNVVVAAVEAVVGTAAKVVAQVAAVVGADELAADLRDFGNRLLADASCIMENLTESNPSCPKLEVGLTGTGNGTVTGEGINCPGDCSERYVPVPGGSNRYGLSASPSLNSIFTGWSGACSGTGSCVVEMDQDRTVYANFDRILYALSVLKTGTGSGTITGGGIDCGATCSGTFPIGTAAITLTASPTDNSIFTGWSGVCSGTDACVITLDGDKTVTANFVRLYALSVSKTGTGTGTVTGQDINCGAKCSGAYSSGTAVSLTAAPSGGSTFVGWSGVCSGTGACAITMDSDKSVTAAFNLYKINVTVNTPEKGKVESSPAGINCGTDCSETFTTPKTLTLTAEANPNHIFKSWEGCTPLADNPAKCTVYIDGPKTVIANFLQYRIMEVAP